MHAMSLAVVGDAPTDKWQAGMAGLTYTYKVLKVLKVLGNDR